MSLDPDLNVVPALARTWIVSPDGLTYRFQLRSDVRFQNGRKLTADDVAWSFLRAARIPGGLAREFVGKIAGGEEASAGRAATIAGLRVEGEVGARHHADRALRALPRIARDPPALRRSAGGGRGEGSGVRPSSRWEPARSGSRSGGSDGRLVLVANETHWGGRPFLDRVDVHLGTWDEDAVGPFLRGEVDMALLGRNDRARLPSGSIVVERQELGMTCLGLNSAFPPMDDERVRRAVALSLDRDAIVLASRAIAMPSRAIIPVGMAGGGPRAFAPERDVAEARRVLAAAGYPDGRGLPPARLLGEPREPVHQGRGRRHREEPRGGGYPGPGAYGPVGPSSSRRWTRRRRRPTS